MDSDLEMEMDYYRDAIWELSNFKKAQWTPRNDLMISKKSYKIFVIPEACQGILEKQKGELWTLMDEVKKGTRSNPFNVEVAKPLQDIFQSPQYSYS